MNTEQIAQQLRKFATERDWEQFHTPKNLAISISVEAAELLELFQWTKGQNGWADLDDPSLRAEVADEIADIIMYIIRFADLAGLDLGAVCVDKIAKNAKKYPADQFKGSDRKYSE